MFESTQLQRALVVLMRFSIGWTFLFAGIRQVPDAEWTAAGFLSGAKTFPGFFEMVASPSFLPIIDVVIPWAHLLIGAALIAGLFFRLAGAGGAVLMILYYLPRLDFPMVGANAFIVEYHLVYAILIGYLMVIGAGRVFGLDGWLDGRPAVRAYLERYPVIRLAMG